jgi:hypothetical protein
MRGKMKRLAVFGCSASPCSYPQVTGRFAEKKSIVVVTSVGYRVEGAATVTPPHFLGRRRGL